MLRRIAAGEQKEGQHRDETAGQTEHRTSHVLHTFPLEFTASVLIVPPGQRCCDLLGNGKQKNPWTIHTLVLHLPASPSLSFLVC
jgi:hypothetical protein